VTAGWNICASTGYLNRNNSRCIEILGIIKNKKMHREEKVIYTFICEYIRHSMKKIIFSVDFEISQSPSW
jgi:hypothetical protein